MDYFELYGLKVSLLINRSYNQKKYYELCRLHHPDHFTLASHDQQMKAEMQLATINDAKKVLDDEYRRLAYILQLKGHLKEDERYDLPPTFLAEMMDINEMLMEMEFEPNENALQAIKQEIQSKKEKLSSQLESYRNMDDLQLDENAITMLKAYYFQMKYLNRIDEKLN
jgi:molecular chaperone HscB